LEPAGFYFDLLLFCYFAIYYYTSSRFFFCQLAITTTPAIDRPMFFLISSEEEDFGRKERSRRNLGGKQTTRLTRNTNFCGFFALFSFSDLFFSILPPGPPEVWLFLYLQQLTGLSMLVGGNVAGYLMSLGLQTELASFWLLLHTRTHAFGCCFSVVDVWATTFFGFFSPIDRMIPLPIYYLPTLPTRKSLRTSRAAQNATSLSSSFP